MGIEPAVQKRGAGDTDDRSVSSDGLLYFAFLYNMQAPTSVPSARQGLVMGWMQRSILGENTGKFGEFHSTLLHIQIGGWRIFSDFWSKNYPK